MNEEKISIKRYEQAANDRVSLGGIKWEKKWDVCVQCDSREEAEALRAALAQPEPEPVAWYYAGSDVECHSIAIDADLDDEQKANCTPLYAAPPQLGPQPKPPMTREKWLDIGLQRGWINRHAFMSQAYTEEE